MKIKNYIVNVLLLVCLATLQASAQPRPVEPVTVRVDHAQHGYAIPTDFIGLGFETASELPNHYEVSGYFFSPANRQLITLFQNIGVKEIRVGGGTVDGSGPGGHCGTPPPTLADVSELFRFARAAKIKVLYSLRLLNPDACRDPHLASDDARIAQYIWRRYRANLDYFAIGNEPDVGSFHSYPGHIVDRNIYEAVPGVAGSAYPSYLAAWRKVAHAILRLVPQAKFAGPDTAVSATSSYTPNPATGMSWTDKFIQDEAKSGIVSEATQHHYVWGIPGDTTARTAMNDMLSSAWDDDTSIGWQPADRGGKARFHPYPYVYSHILAPLVSRDVPYRMTEANDCLHGVEGASNGYASALWALDYMHWWAAHHMAGVNFHNNPWIPTDTIVPNPNPCAPSGCRDYHINPKGYGIKAFDLGGHGYVEPVTLSNPDKIDLTAYAVGAARNLYVTLINKTHDAASDTTDAAVTIRTGKIRAASVASIVLTDGSPGDAGLRTATIGGASIPNDGRWRGRWTPLPAERDGEIQVSVPATTAAVVRIQAAGNTAGPVQMNQNGALEIFGANVHGQVWHNRQQDVSDGGRERWSGWSTLGSGLGFRAGIAVAGNLDNTLEVFASRRSGDVYYKRQVTPDGAWSGWVDMGDSSHGMTDLKVANNADGSLSVFGIGANGDVWYASQNAPGGDWSGWKDLSGEHIQPGFVVAENLDGRVMVFGTDRKGSLWYAGQDSADHWTVWRELPGRPVRAQLAAARDLSGRISIFGMGRTRGDIRKISQETADGRFANWSKLPMRGLDGIGLQPGFVVGQDADGRLEIAAVGKDGRAWCARERTTKKWSDWQTLGGEGLEPNLVVTNTADGRLQLFAAGRNQKIWSNRQRQGGEGWSGWTDFGGTGIRFFSH